MNGEKKSDIFVGWENIGKRLCVFFHSCYLKPKKALSFFLIHLDGFVIVLGNWLQPAETVLLCLWPLCSSTPRPPFLLVLEII